MKKININILIATTSYIIALAISLTGIYITQYNVMLSLFFYGVSALFSINGILWKIYNELQKQNKRMAKQTHSNNPKTAA